MNDDYTLQVTREHTGWSYAWTVKGTNTVVLRGACSGTATETEAEADQCLKEGLERCTIPSSGLEQRVEALEKQLGRRAYRERPILDELDHRMCLREKAAEEMEARLNAAPHSTVEPASIKGCQIRELYEWAGGEGTISGGSADCTNMMEQLWPWLKDEGK